MYNVYFLTIGLDALASTTCRFLQGDTFEWLQKMFNIIKIIVPILLIALVMIDIVKAATGGDEKAMKKAQGDAIKRIVAGVIIFFLPIIVEALLHLLGNSAGVCNLE